MQRLSARAKAVDRWLAAQVDDPYRIARPATTPPLRKAPPTRHLPDTQAG